MMWFCRYVLTFLEESVASVCLEDGGWQISPSVKSTRCHVVKTTRLIFSIWECQMLHVLNHNNVQFFLKKVGVGVVSIAFL